MRTVADFRESIGTAIPQMISRLGYKDWEASFISADALAGLSEQGKYLMIMYLIESDEDCSRLSRIN